MSRQCAPSAARTFRSPVAPALVALLSRDDDPIATTQFRTRLELTTARAPITIDDASILARLPRIETSVPAECGAEVTPLGTDGFHTPILGSVVALFRLLHDVIAAECDVTGLHLAEGGTAIAPTQIPIVAGFACIENLIATLRVVLHLETTGIRAAIATLVICIVALLPRIEAPVPAHRHEEARRRTWGTNPTIFPPLIALLPRFNGGIAALSDGSRLHLTGGGAAIARHSIPVIAGFPRVQDMIATDGEVRALLSTRITRETILRPMITLLPKLDDAIAAVRSEHTRRCARISRGSIPPPVVTLFTGAHAPIPTGPGK